MPDAAPPASTGFQSRIRHWLDQPLLQFLLIGAVIFSAYTVLNRDTAPSDEGQVIILTEDDLLQLAVAYRAQGFPEPGPQQMAALVETKIREEVLYREALAMGLDRDDTIVRRRMAQKMDFLAEDLSTLREPTRAELEDWLKTHPKDFAIAPRTSFRHIYFSFDDRGSSARTAAASALTRAAGLPAGSPEAAALGDPFMLEDSYADRTPSQVKSLFGARFAEMLFSQQPGKWSGPIESGFGWHLVFIESLTPARAPEFEEVESEVRAEWIASQRAEFKRHAYEVLRAKYDVILPAGSVGMAGTAGSPGSPDE